MYMITLYIVFLTPIMAFISKITGSGALWIVIALLLMLQKKYRVLGVAIIIALGFVFIIGDQGLKPHVARLRPFVDLTIQYNRARQAAITQEITEIVAGASALE